MYRSICVLALFALCAYAMDDSVKQLVAKCADESGLDLSQPDSHMENGQPDRKMKCFHTCLGINSGSLQADGSLNAKLMIDHIPANTPNKAALIKDIEECSKQKGKDKCETGYKSGDCCHKKKIFERMGLQ